MHLASRHRIVHHDYYIIMARSPSRDSFEENHVEAGMLGQVHSITREECNIGAECKVNQDVHFNLPSNDRFLQRMVFAGPRNPPGWKCVTGPQTEM